MGQNYAKKIEKKRCHSEKCFNFANKSGGHTMILIEDNTQVIGGKKGIVKVSDVLK